MILKHVSPNFELSDDIAIVGSSGRLKDGHCVECINSHEQVIRFNRAPVEGYEHIIGGKTSLRVVNNHVFDNIDAGKNGFTNQDKNFIKKQKNCSILYIAPDIGPYKRRGQNTDDSNTLYLFNYDIIENVMGEFNYNMKLKPTIGAITVFLCVMSGVAPHLYGFDTEERRFDHYWEKRPRPGPCHDIDCEKIIYQRLYNDGKVVLHK